MIPLPFLDDMSLFFINNIDNHPKRKTLYNDSSNNFKNIIGNQNKKKLLPNKGLYNKDNNIINNNNDFNTINVIKENIIEENKKEDTDVCPEHKYKIEYYCVQ